ncbi:MAG: TIGR03067 domain-containing protein [Verrucomicrobia bacterium]|nr:TIGR03067 domain-containing protein [Verrucomicrobiota bacterium]
MKHPVTSFLPGAILAAGLGLLPLFPADSPAADAKPLQGVWRGARFSSGKGEDPDKGVALELTIKDSHINGKRLPEEKPIAEGDFKLSADGKCMDATGSTGGFKGKTFPGIFKIEGDMLFWCVTTNGNTQDRPTGFVAEPAKKSYLIIVKRQES